MHNNSYEPGEQPEEKDQARSDKDPLWPYIGDWQALQNGTAHSMLLKELIESGIQPRIGQTLPLEDPLARYKDIPLHARFLYTSLDPSIESYILNHYVTIDSLARDKCDIYLSIRQFHNPGETIDYLENSLILRTSGVQIGYHDLPGIFSGIINGKGNSFLSGDLGTSRRSLQSCFVFFKRFEKIQPLPL